MYPSQQARRLKKSKTRTVETILEQIRKITFSHVLAALNIGNMTRENQVCSWRSSDALKCCACVAKRIAVTIVKVKSIKKAVRIEQMCIKRLRRWFDAKMSTSTG